MKYRYKCLNKACNKKWESDIKCKKCISCICMVLEEKEIIPKKEKEIDVDIMAPDTAIDELFDTLEE